MVPCSRSKTMRDKVQSVTSTNWTQTAHVHAWLSLWEIGGGNTGQGKESSLLSSHLPTQSFVHNTYYIFLQQACLASTRVSDQQHLDLVVTATRKNRNSGMSVHIFLLYSIAVCWSVLVPNVISCTLVLSVYTMHSFGVSAQRLMLHVSHFCTHSQGLVPTLSLNNQYPLRHGKVESASRTGSLVRTTFFARYNTTHIISFYISSVKRVKGR